jgi:hypothetical protein
MSSPNFLYSPQGVLEGYGPAPVSPDYGGGGSKGFIKNDSVLAPDAQQGIEQSVSNSDPANDQAKETYELGASSGSTGQTTIGTAATLIKVRNACRRAIKITNLGATDVFISFSLSVNPISGDLLLGVKGSFIVIPTTLDVYGIVATGSQLISWMELSE